MTETPHVSIADQVDALALDHPDKLLFCFLDARGQEIDRYSYADFVDHTRRLSWHLTHRLGFAAGSRLLLAYPAGLDMVAAFYACARAGIIPVPVPPIEARGADAALNRIAHIAEDCQASAILSTRDGVAVARRAVGEERLAALSWIETDDVDLEAVDDSAIASMTNHPGGLLFLQYTSGSTSEPKGVEVSHDNVIHNRALIVDHEDPIAVTWLPQHHDMGLIGYYLFIALSGGSVYGFSPTTFVQRPILWLEAITRYRATCTSAPNFAFEYCLRPGRLTPDRLAKLDLSTMRIFMAAAEPIKPETYARFLQTLQPCGLDPKSFFVAYGLAEFTLAVTGYGRRTISVAKKDLARRLVRITESASGIAGAMHLLSCGRPLGDSEVAIVDPDTHQMLPSGQVGEIWLAGRSKCSGYWNREATSNETFAACPAAAANGAMNGHAGPAAHTYLRTGDMGFMHEGELFVCGRNKDMMIVRGQNIFPQDIEMVAEQVSPDIRRSCGAAFEVPGEEANRIVLALETVPSVGVEPVDVARAVRASLSVELDEVIFVGARDIPKTSSGKVMRFGARERYLDGQMTIRHRYERDASVENDAHLDDERPFAALLNRYQLTGTEAKSLLDVGVDSLDLVLFMHELQEMLSDKGASDVADQVDIRLVQRMTVAEIVSVATAFLDAPEAALLTVRERLADVRKAQHETEQRQMRADTHLSYRPAPLLNGAGAALEAALVSPKHALLTGATGFLGPFLLISILRQTQARVTTLIRASSPDEARKRLKLAVSFSGLEPEFDPAFYDRIDVVCGTLDQPRLGLSEAEWERLTHDVDTIYHNGALVNYLFDYARMRATNVTGTQELIKFAFDGHRSVFNHISTTFIHGWATKPTLLESDNNDEMALLDFGYSQTKWASERLVSAAGDAGLPVRIFRPALITPSADGQGNNFDISIRLMAFMVKHGIGVNSHNQVSFLPADVTANNIVAISGLPDTIGGTFHVVRDDYSHMADFTDTISRQIGRHFELFSLNRFVPEVIRRCTREDLLFPLIDFLIGSVDNISAMEFKRYDSTEYQAARNRSPHGLPDPSLEDTVAGILSFLDRKGALEIGSIGRRPRKVEPRTASEAYHSAVS